MLCIQSSKWMKFTKQVLSPSGIEIYKSDVTWQVFIDRLCNAYDTEFVQLLMSLTKPYYLEFPKLYQNELNTKNFEFSITYTTTLSSVADQTAFSDYINSVDSQYTFFWNLNHDAVLFIPTTLTDDVNCANLYTFLNTRYEPQSSSHSLSDLILGQTMFQTFFDTLIYDIFPLFDVATPLWISTHGNGVPWLHIRVCTKPKYYSNTLYSQSK